MTATAPHLPFPQSETSLTPLPSSHTTSERTVSAHVCKNFLLWLRMPFVIFAVVWFWAAPAQAHTGTGLAGGFISGVLHPVTGFDHLLAMVSVGLWGAILGRPLVVALPVIFPAMMVVGALLGMLNFPLPPVEVGIAASVLLLGGVIVWGYKAPTWVACVLVATFALFHGFAHGQELPSAADPVGYSTGFVLSTGSLHILGIAIGLLHDTIRGRWIVKGLGAFITLAGCAFLYQAMA